MQTRFDTLSVASLSQKCSGTNLPTNMDVIKHCYYAINKLKSENPTFLNKSPTYNDFKHLLIEDICQIWSYTHVPLIDARSINKKLKTLWEKFKKRLKLARKRGEGTIEEGKYQNLFDLCTCRCDVGDSPPIRYGRILCSCPMES